MIGAFIDGPFWYFSLLVFLLGVAWRLLTIVRNGVARDLAPARGDGTMGAVRTIFSRALPRRPVMHGGRVQMIAGYLFHLGLFALLLFAQPHIDFYAERLTGFSWSAMPHWGFILASEIAFAGLILLWIYRVMNPVTRLLSGVGDHVASLLVFLVMFTGCLALGQSHEALRLIHLFLAELLLLYFPFSSLMHAFTFAISRGYTGAAMARKGVNA
jgi:nitrate reductase gamma subunit